MDLSFLLDSLPYLVNKKNKLIKMSQQKALRRSMKRVLPLSLLMLIGGIIILILSFDTVLLPIEELRLLFLYMGIALTVIAGIIYIIALYIWFKK